MRSKLYKKHHVSKYLFPTHMIRGSGNTKGKVVIGHTDAKSEVERRIGRKLEVDHIEENVGEWIFCERRSHV